MKEKKQEIKSSSRRGALLRIKSLSTYRNNFIQGKKTSKKGTASTFHKMTETKVPGNIQMIIFKPNLKKKTGSIDTHQKQGREVLTNADGVAEDLLKKRNNQQKNLKIKAQKSLGRTLSFNQWIIIKGKLGQYKLSISSRGHFLVNTKDQSKSLSKVLEEIGTKTRSGSEDLETVTNESFLKIAKDLYGKNSILPYDVESKEFLRIYEETFSISTKYKRNSRYIISKKNECPFSEKQQFLRNKEYSKRTRTSRVQTKGVREC